MGRSIEIRTEPCSHVTDLGLELRITGNLGLYLILAMYHGRVIHIHEPSHASQGMAANGISEIESNLAGDNNGFDTGAGNQVGITETKIVSHEFEDGLKGHHIMAAEGISVCLQSR